MPKTAAISTGSLFFSRPSSLFFFGANRQRIVKGHAETEFLPTDGRYRGCVRALGSGVDAGMAGHPIRGTGV